MMVVGLLVVTIHQSKLHYCALVVKEVLDFFFRGCRRQVVIFCFFAFFFSKKEGLE